MLVWDCAWVGLFVSLMPQSLNLSVLMVDDLDSDA